MQNRRHNWEPLGMKLSTDRATKKEQMLQAEVCRAKRELQLASGEWNIIDRTAGKKTLIQYMKEMGVGKSKKDAFLRTIPYVEKYKDGGNIQLTAVTAQWIKGFQDWLLNETGLAQMTVYHYSSAIRTVFRQAIIDRALMYNPCVAVKNVTKPRKNLPHLTIEELQLLAVTPCNGKLGEEIKRAFLFACMTGLRIGDIAGRENTKGDGALKWENIEIRKTSDENKSKHWINKVQNKVNRPVEIPLNETAWELIQPQKFPTEFVFDALAKSGTHTDKYIKAWVAKAGITKKVGMHTARRTYATLLQRERTDSFTLKRLMGHKDSDVTSLYANSSKLLPEAVLKLDSILLDSPYLKEETAQAV